MPVVVELNGLVAAAIRALVGLRITLDLWVQRRPSACNTVMVLSGSELK